MKLKVAIILLVSGDRPVRWVSRHPGQLHVRPHDPEALHQHERHRPHMVEEGGAHLAHGARLRLQDGGCDVAGLRRANQEPHSDTLLPLWLPRDVQAASPKCNQLDTGRRGGRNVFTVFTPPFVTLCNRWKEAALGAILKSGQPPIVIYIFLNLSSDCIGFHNLSAALPLLQNPFKPFKDPNEEEKQDVAGVDAA